MFHRFTISMENVFVLFFFASLSHTNLCSKTEDYVYTQSNIIFNQYKHDFWYRARIIIRGIIILAVVLASDQCLCACTYETYYVVIGHPFKCAEKKAIAAKQLNIINKELNGMFFSISSENVQFDFIGIKLDNPLFKHERIIRRLLTLCAAELH